MPVNNRQNNDNSQLPYVMLPEDGQEGYGYDAYDPEEQEYEEYYDDDEYEYDDDDDDEYEYDEDDEYDDDDYYEYDDEDDDDEDDYDYQEVAETPQPAPQARKRTGGSAANAHVEEEDERKKRGKGFIIGIIVAAIAVVLAIILAVSMLMAPPQKSRRGGELGQLDGKTAEEIQAELDRLVEDGMFNISIASVVEFPDGTSEGELKIENSPANHYLMQVDINDEKTGDLLYSSEILEPNYHVQTAKLIKDLEPGEYECVATFHALDEETEEEIGQAAAKILIVVQS